MGASFGTAEGGFPFVPFRGHALFFFGTLSFFQGNSRTNDYLAVAPLSFFSFFCKKKYLCCSLNRPAFLPVLPLWSQKNGGAGQPGISNFPVFREENSVFRGAHHFLLRHPHALYTPTPPPRCLPFWDDFRNWRYFRGARIHQVYFLLPQPLHFRPKKVYFNRDCAPYPTLLFFARVPLLAFSKPWSFCWVKKKTLLPPGNVSCPKFRIFSDSDPPGSAKKRVFPFSVGAFSDAVFLLPERTITFSSPKTGQILGRLFQAGVYYPRAELRLPALQWLKRHGRRIFWILGQLVLIFFSMVQGCRVPRQFMHFFFFSGGGVDVSESSFRWQKF